MGNQRRLPEDIAGCLLGSRGIALVGTLEKGTSGGSIVFRISQGRERETVSRGGSSLVFIDECA